MLSSKGNGGGNSSSINEMSLTDKKVNEHIEELFKTAESAVVASQQQQGLGGQRQEQQNFTSFINALEGANNENNRLLGTLADRTGLLKMSIAEEAGDLHVKVQDMGNAFAGLFERYRNLQLSFDSAQSIATRSGKLIEPLHQHKQRAQAAKELLLIFLEIASGKGTARLDALLESNSSESRIHGSRLMRMLKSLAEAGIAGEEAAKTVKEIAERYEQKLLTDFSAAFDENDLGGMKSAASLLVNYNGGESCIQSFVSQHAFFIDPIPKESIKSSLHPSINSGPLDLGKAPIADPILVSLYEQIAKTAEADWNYLEAVFDDPIRVMSHLIQRVFCETVHVHLEEILKQARAHSTLAYLRALYAAYEATRVLITRMRKSFAKHIKSIGSKTDLLSTIVDEKLSSLDMQLDTLLATLFASHLKLDSYLDFEMSVFSELVRGAIESMQTYAVQIKKASRGGVMSLTNAVLGGVTGRGSGASSPMPPRSPATGTLDKYAPLYIFADGRSLATSLTDSASSSSTTHLPSTIILKHCLALHAELSIRLFTLLPAGGEAKGRALLQTVKILFGSIFDRYLELALDCASEVSEASSKGFDPRSLIVIQSTIQVLGLVLLYFRERFLPIIVTASPPAYREMVQLKTEAAARVTGKIDDLLRKECACVLEHVEEQLLSKQKKSDFKPKDSDLLEFGPSQACEATFDFVGKVTKTVIEKLDSKNAQSFLTELGSGLHVLLLRHLKGFTISDAGAMVIQNDLKKYYSLIEVMYPAKENLRDRFEMLLELGRLFVVRPDNLRTVMQEGFLGRLDPKLIYPYLAMRADYSAAKIEQLFPEMEKSFTRLFL